jgi:hypothetical protein
MIAATGSNNPSPTQLQSPANSIRYTKINRNHRNPLKTNDGATFYPLQTGTLAGGILTELEEPEGGGFTQIPSRPESNTQPDRMESHV